MQDIIGRFWVIIIACFAILITPVLIISLKQDALSQSIVDNAAAEFVENAVGAGNFTLDGYYKLLSDVNKIGTPCEVNIIHSTSVMYGEEVVLGTSASGQPLISYDVGKTMIDHGTEEVLTALIRDGEYGMKQGDYLKVTVKNTQPTMGSKLYGLIMKRFVSKDIYTCYSSVVGNKKQD